MSVVWELLLAIKCTKTLLNSAHVSVGPEDHSVVSEDCSMAYNEDTSVLGPFSSLSRDAEPFQVIPWQASKIGSFSNLGDELVL